MRNVDGRFIKAMKLFAKSLRKVKEPTVRSIFAENFANEANSIIQKSPQTHGNDGFKFNTYAMQAAFSHQKPQGAWKSYACLVKDLEISPLFQVLSSDRR